MNIHSVLPTHRHVVLVYLAKTKTDKAVLAPIEHKQLRWFTVEELLAEPELDKTVHYYAAEALRRVKV